MTRSRKGWVIALTFIVALMLSLMPLPDWAAAFRPQWVALVLIYWSMALPHRVSVGIGWLVGLFVDVATGALLGQHALGFAIIAYLSVRLHQRVRVFPLAQQALVVTLILLPHMILGLWIRGITGHALDTGYYWAPLISSAILWPWMFILLRAIRRGAGVA